jgi:hypothetical protein
MNTFFLVASPKGDQSRQPYGEAGTLAAAFAFGTRRTAVKLDQIANDRQPQP